MPGTGSVPRPETPPPLSTQRARELLLDEHASDLFTASLDERYLHWDDLRYRAPPSGVDRPTWWHRTRIQRQVRSQQLPLRDVAGRQFSHVLTNGIQKRLHDLSLRVGGRIQMPDGLTEGQARDRYYVASLVEEAITSRQHFCSPRPTETTSRTSSSTSCT